MSVPLIDEDFYDQIRGALGADITVAEVSDALIAMPIYIGAGINEVLIRDPIAESRTGAELIRVQNAAVLFTAAFLVPTLIQAKSEKEGDITLTYNQYSLDKLYEMLRLRAMSELDAVLGQLNLRPTMFTVASGRRGL